MPRREGIRQIDKRQFQEATCGGHPVKVIAEGLRFPEGPVALADGSVLVAEIAGGTIKRVDPDGTIALVATVGGGPNGLALGPDGGLYVCNNGGLNFRQDGDYLRAGHGLPADYTTGSIQRVDLGTGTAETLYTHCGDIPLRGSNDLVFDADGGFYFTDFGKTVGRVRDIGAVFYARCDGSRIVEVIHPIANPNGIGLSPDGRTLYVAETETCRLWAYPVLEPGKVEMGPLPSLNGGRLVAGLDGFQRFDSLAVDAAGNICVATLVTGCITVLSPRGDVLEQVRFPDPHTTNICFGGQDMRTAFVTQSWTGKLIRTEWTQPGLRLNFQS
ncbi:SMP-30/gluconolactonase/LRE family protein [Methylobacterium indicum]|nr:SMP-30/gluconolactonase/LRE family protein [Methylobacterium indicum]